MSLPEIISIHAPYKRVRPKYRKQVTAEAIISIHAPYKRVRPTSLIRRTGSLNFNPRTLQESATVFPYTDADGNQFQSTQSATGPVYP